MFGGLRTRDKNGAWCVGCRWALVASLFAFGVMSVIGIAIVAGLIAIEKSLPWRRVLTDLDDRMASVCLRRCSSPPSPP